MDKPLPKSQRKSALEALASKGPYMLTTNPTPREQAIAALRLKTKSPTLGIDGSARRTRRRKRSRKTRRHSKK